MGCSLSFNRYLSNKTISFVDTLPQHSKSSSSSHALCLYPSVKCSSWSYVIPNSVLVNIFNLLERPANVSLVCRSWFRINQSRRSEDLYREIGNSTYPILKWVYKKVERESLASIGIERTSVSSKDEMEGVRKIKRVIDLLRNFSIRIAFDRKELTVSTFNHLNKTVFENFAMLREGQAFADLSDLCHDDFNTVELDLTDKSLSVLSERIAKFKNLELLNVTNNGLRTLPMAISLLKKLEILDISNNGLEDFPDALLSCDSLRVLNVENTQLLDIPDLSRLTRLGTLICGSNELRSFPTAVLPSLTELDLSHNKIAAIESVSNVPNVQILNLNNNRLRILPRDFTDLRLTDLDIGNNRWEESHLLDCVLRISSLVRFSAAGTGLSSLPEDLSHLAHLTSLDLSENSYSHFPLGGLTLPNIRSLNLSSNDMQTFFVDGCKPMIGLRTITELDIGDNPMLGDSLMAFDFTRLPSLEVLKCYHTGLKAIPTSIYECSILREIDFSGNLLSVLPFQLTQLVKLRFADFSENPLMYDDMDTFCTWKALGEFIPEDCLLVDIDDEEYTELDDDVR